VSVPETVGQVPRVDPDIGGLPIGVKPLDLETGHVAMYTALYVNAHPDLSD
jgi:hypothetical protein